MSQVRIRPAPAASNHAIEQSALADQQSAISNQQSAI
jgi:hypothetical protein